MIHECCPQTMTPENLADWIRSNKVDTYNHVEKIPLTDEEKSKLAMESSSAGQAITRLENLKKYFDAFIKKGTPWDSNVGENGDHRPLTITIPPTKGIEKLKSNRSFADEQISKGHREEVTPIYFIPWPEFKKMVALNIKGEEWSVYSRDMKPDEIRQHGKPILEATQEIKDIMEDQGLHIEKVDGKEVKITKKNKKSLLDEQMPLSDGEKREIEGPDSDDVLGIEKD